MTYNEKELKEIQDFVLNKDVKINEMNKDKFYFINVEIDESTDRERCFQYLSRLKECLQGHGLNNFLIVPKIDGITAIKLFEIEVVKDETNS